MPPTFKKIGETIAFIHPCSKCGDPVAPFGVGVRLRAAMAARDAQLAGRWLCGACWREEKTT